MPAVHSNLGVRMADRRTVFVGTNTASHFGVRTGTGRNALPRVVAEVGPRHPSRFQMVPHISFDQLEDMFWCWALDLADGAPAYRSGSEPMSDSDDDMGPCAAWNYPVTEYYDSGCEDDSAGGDGALPDDLLRSAKRLKLSDDGSFAIPKALILTPQASYIRTSPACSAPSFPVASSTSSADPFGSHVARDSVSGAASGAANSSAAANSEADDLPACLMDRVSKVVVKTYFLK